jgi:hypothetical protein
MKYKSDVWQQCTDSERLKAKRITNSVIFYSVMLLITISGLTIYNINNVCAVGAETLDISVYDCVLNEVNTFVLIALSLLALIIVSYVFEKKNIVGKLSFLDIILIIIAVLSSYGIILIIALLLTGIIRQSLIRKVNPEFLRNNPEVSGNNRLNALQCLSDGIKLEKERKYKEAKTKYLKAYNYGDGRGAYYLARMYEDGLGVMTNIDTSLEWEKKAADKGVSISQYYIGIEYINGKNIRKNESLGLSYLKESANQNEYDACIYLGIKHGTSLDSVYFDLDKAEYYLKKAVASAENDQELAIAYNELGRLLIGIWAEANSKNTYVLALQAFSKSKDLRHKDGEINYKEAVSRKPSDYPSLIEMLNKKDLDNYLSTTNDETIIEEYETISDNEESVDYEDITNDEVIIEDTTNLTKDQIADLKSLRKSLIIVTIVKLIFFGTGLFLVLYGYNNSPTLGFLSFFVIIGGIVVGGFPGIVKAFNDSYKYNEKWDRFFNVAKYKATVDYNKKTVKIKKNDDWLSIIFVTIMNLIKAAMAIPFEALRDIYRVIVISKKIGKI